MAVREATSRTEDPAGPRPDRRRRRRDLRAGPFPTAAMEQWQDTEAALTQLYRHAEGRAIDAVDWAAECARSAARTVDPKQVKNRLALLRAFSDDVAALLQQETAEWVLELQSNLLRLERSNRASSGSVPLHGTAEP